MKILLLFLYIVAIYLDVSTSFSILLFFIPSFILGLGSFFPTSWRTLFNYLVQYLL